MNTTLLPPFAHYVSSFIPRNGPLPQDQTKFSPFLKDTSWWGGLAKNAKVREVPVRHFSFWHEPFLFLYFHDQYARVARDRHLSGLRHGQNEGTMGDFLQRRLFFQLDGKFCGSRFYYTTTIMLCKKDGMREEREKKLEKNLKINARQQAHTNLYLYQLNQFSPNYYNFNLDDGRHALVRILPVLESLRCIKSSTVSSCTDAILLLSPNASWRCSH